MYRLLVAAMATKLSLGCQLVCRIFLVKSRLSTFISSLTPAVCCLAPFSTALRFELSDGDALPFVVQLLLLFVAGWPFRFGLMTRLGRSCWRGLLCSREHSNICSCFVVRWNDLKKLLYEPLKMYSSFELQLHSNLSNMQSFSYNMHSLFLK